MFSIGYHLCQGASHGAFGQQPPAQKDAPQKPEQKKK